MTSYDALGRGAFFCPAARLPVALSAAAPESSSMLLLAMRLMYRSISKLCRCMKSIAIRMTSESMLSISMAPKTVL